MIPSFAERGGHGVEMGESEGPLGLAHGRDAGLEPLGDIDEAPVVLQHASPIPA